MFSDEGRSKEEGVLVHCLAGISRSVTITMAYLMFKMGLSLNEAYDLVRSRKSNISPNFHFMGQLLDFERQLTTCQFLSPPALGSSPDSGIEFDRWNAHWLKLRRLSEMSGGTTTSTTPQSSTLRSQPNQM